MRTALVAISAVYLLRGLILLPALAFAPDGVLRATVQADSPAAVEALRQRVETSGFAAEATAPRSGAGRRVADITVRPR